MIHRDLDQDGLQFKVVIGKKYSVIPFITRVSFS